MIEIILYIILTCCFLMMIRNLWVYKIRMRLIDEDFELYRSLPSYDAMLIKFWIWDVNHFVRRSRNG
jgi:hypothetical protein